MNRFLRHTKTTPDALRLLFEGGKVLGRMEANGVKVDEAYLKAVLALTEKQIAEAEFAMRESSFFREWKKAFGDRANLDAVEQIAHVLYDRMGFPCTQRTEPTDRYPQGKPKADESALSAIDLPFLKDWFHARKLKKARSTYLVGIQREVVNGFVHPSYNLNTVKSFRSSCDNPNWQNNPVRNPEIAEMVRRCYVARGAHRRIVDWDFGGIEVKVAYDYHEDPVMWEYLTDPAKDMHRDMAAECFLLDPSMVDKKVRYVGKNMFVFPQFYGSFYIDCAKNLWEACDRLGLSFEDDGATVPLRQHLAEQDITELGDCDERRPPRPGTFEAHLKKVEEDFWGRRFKHYAQWKRDWYDRYLETGGFPFLSGFYVEGSMKRNEVINYPVQGSAFHCELLSCVEVQRRLDHYRMKSLLIGEVHDSHVADVPDDELQAYNDICHEVMTVWLPKRWEWLKAPMEAEVEVGEPGGSWFTKKVWERRSEEGPWTPKA